ncbi:MAG: hypothetical protein E7467_05070 [Ruminococcaceae bacterium]|nr:hypothetical protein [Oscillospiraceae bacterium]
MFNPELIKTSEPYDAQEGCLSLPGDPRIKTFVGWPAQIIQHEIDHCNGVLI